MDYKNLITVVVPLGLNRELLVEDSLNKNKVSYFIERGQNPSENRNRGAGKAKTPLVCFVNAHSILTDNWAEEVAGFFERHNDIDIVGGPQLTKQDENFFARASGYALSSVFGTADLRDRYQKSEAKLRATEKEVTLANLICKSHVVKKIHFDEKIYPGEDVKFIHEAEKAGYRIAYSPNIVVYNTRRKQASGFYGLTKQIFNYGRVRPRVEGLGSLAKKPLFLVPSLFLLYLAALPFLVAYIDSLFFLPLTLYMLLDLFFSAYESIRHKHAESFFLLPFVFIVIHVSYGLGFLYGLITKTTALASKR